MTENTKNSTAQNTIQDQPEYNTEKQGSDWLGGPQNGSEIPGNAGNGGNGGNASGNGGNGQVTSDESASTKNHETWTGRGKP